MGKPHKLLSLPQELDLFPPYYTTLSITPLNISPPYLTLSTWHHIYTWQKFVQSTCMLPLLYWKNIFVYKSYQHPSASPNQLTYSHFCNSARHFLFPQITASPPAKSHPPDSPLTTLLTITSSLPLTFHPIKCTFFHHKYPAFFALTSHLLRTLGIPPHSIYSSTKPDFTCIFA